MTTYRMPVAVLMAVVATGSLQGLPDPFEGPPVQSPRGEIDRLVFGRLAELEIESAHLCSDGVFVRRVYLDVIGTLPTAVEAREFLQDESREKRALLIDRLLEREEFADYWALKWGDLLRVKAEFPINLWPNAVQAYHRWIRAGIRENQPYDQFVREMLTASGSNFRVPQVNFYRAVQDKDPETIAQAVALTFMGERTMNWPEERRAGMAVFFSQIGFKSTAEWKEEIVYHDATQASGERERAGEAQYPDGTLVRLRPDQDPRVVFADWLISPDNPWFARNLVNRVWSWLLGRGVVDEPDDIRPDNPPVNPALLAWLEGAFLGAEYDLKHLYRLILNSQVYQLASIPRSRHPEAGANFAYYPLRRLDAEVLVDALCQITGTTEEYTSAIPEPFTFIPEGHRSIELGDGSITSAFLEMFGRPSRDTGLESERNNCPTAAQRLHLLNSSHIQRKIERSRKLRLLTQGRRPPREMVSEVYLTVLSRYPTPEELGAMQSYARSGTPKGQQTMVDLVWALVNSAEFLYRH